jgi:hypothetical protein
MHFTDFDWIKFFEADYLSFNSEFAQEVLFQDYKSWEYNNVDDIEKILHTIYDVFDQRLNELLVQNNCVWLLEFLYMQLENAHQIKYAKWENVSLGFYRNPISRKQIYKYLIEKMTSKNITLERSVSITENICNDIVCLWEDLFHLANLIAEVREWLECKIVLKDW